MNRAGINRSDSSRHLPREHKQRRQNRIRHFDFQTRNIPISPPTLGRHFSPSGGRRATAMACRPRLRSTNTITSGFGHRLFIEATRETRARLGELAPDVCRDIIRRLFQPGSSHAHGGWRSGFFRHCMRPFEEPRRHLAGVLFEFISTSILAAGGGRQRTFPNELADNIGLVVPQTRHRATCPGLDEVRKTRKADGDVLDNGSISSGGPAIGGW